MTSAEHIPRVVISFKALIKNKAHKILLIKRPPLNTYFANLWELPGGKLNIDEDINKFLQREVKEETGLTVKTSETPFYIEKHNSVLPKYKGLPYMMLVFKSKTIKGKVKLNEEHVDHKWVLFEDAFKLDLMQETRRALQSLTKNNQ